MTRVHEVLFFETTPFFDLSFSLHGITSRLEFFEIDYFNGSSAEGILCSFTTVVSFFSFAYISAVACVEGIVRTSGEISVVGDIAHGFCAKGKSLMWLKDLPFDSFLLAQGPRLLGRRPRAVLAEQERVEGWSWWESNPRGKSEGFRSPMTVYPEIFDS